VDGRGDEFRRGEAVVEGEIASPRRRVGVGFVTSCVFAYVGLWMALLTPVTVSLALKSDRSIPRELPAASRESSA
jgi:hypothetical protein